MLYLLSSWRFLAWTIPTCMSDHRGWKVEIFLDDTFNNIIHLFWYLAPQNLMRDSSSSTINSTSIIEFLPLVLFFWWMSRCAKLTFYSCVAIIFILECVKHKVVIHIYFGISNRWLIAVSYQIWWPWRQWCFCCWWWWRYYWKWHQNFLLRPWYWHHSR